MATPIREIQVSLQERRFMSFTFLVELATGAIVRKTREELLPSDRIVFDGAEAFQGAQAAQKRLEADIEEAGGLDAWRTAASTK
jgi:hypothetical protein